MEPWQTALIVVAVFAVVVVIARDMDTAYGVHVKGFRQARRRKAEDEAKRERLHRLTHPDEE